MVATAIPTGEDVQALSAKIDASIDSVARLRQRAEGAEAELSLVELDRAKALICLLRLCEAAEREQWPRSAESQQVFERASDLLFEHNITPGLPEPDELILRLLEMIADDDEREQAEYSSFNL